MGLVPQFVVGARRPVVGVPGRCGLAVLRAVRSVI